MENVDMSRPGLPTAGLLAAMPFLLALAVQAMPTRVTPIAAAPPRPPLVFDQYAVDYGHVLPRPVVSAWFQFTNTGRQPLTITSLEPSCGCLDPRLSRDRKTFHPGERGRFDVTVHTANEEPGPHMFTITVHYEDPQPRSETVVFRLNLPEQKVSVEPAELVFYQLNGDESEATLYVSDRRDGAIEVLSATPSLEGVSAELLPPETGDDGAQRVPVRIRVAGDYPSGPHKGFVRIETSDPEFFRLAVPVYVEGAGVRPAGLKSGD
jgi:hypothetical protein